MVESEEKKPSICVVNHMSDYWISECMSLNQEGRVDHHSSSERDPLMEQPSNLRDLRRVEARIFGTKPRGEQELSEVA